MIEHTQYLHEYLISSDALAPSTGIVKDKTMRFVRIYFKYIIIIK